ncbi:pseudouridine synthase [Thiosulfativibrio zosterae]|uniref:Pseudouridine synthase n=1 Tax=Thiosulfativibrio zosterae TaxID=2675053 RepID=A0A6F8PP20_9GAMM|nr:pseudouridine synthase [Thiosulfativibrio zosterae]
MSGHKTRLDRYISQQTTLSKSQVRMLVAQRKIWVDDQIAQSVQQTVDEFCEVRVEGQILAKKTPDYWMLYKPVGVLSATQDAKHPVAVDCLRALSVVQRQDLHLVGRLDLHSSGLLLLTNDGRWSQAMIAPHNKMPKVYQVVVQNPLTEQMVQGFNEGVFLTYEQVTTRPAKLKILAPNLAEVTLWEGRFHQIKRMFKRLGNRVMALHRVQIGPVKLDASLLPGQSRRLTPPEVQALSQVNTATNKENFSD